MTRWGIGLLAVMVGCKPAATPVSAPVPEPQPEPVVEEPPEPVVEKPPSVLDKIRAEFEGETVAIVLRDGAVHAVGASGKQIELAQGDYTNVTVDPATQTLWLGAGWTEVVEDGFYVVDLSEPEFEPVRVMTSPGSIRVIHTMPSERVIVPEEHPWVSLFLGAEILTVFNVEKNCGGNECNVLDAARPLLLDVFGKRELAPGSVQLADPSVHSVIDSKAKCRGCGRFIPIPHTKIGLLSIPTRAHYRHVHWILYDPESDEYISDSDPQERMRKLAPANSSELHVMLVLEVLACEPGGGVIVNGNFWTSDLQFISDSRNNQSSASCLDGGWRFHAYDVLDLL
jgi:hypothetical protein